MVRYRPGNVATPFTAFTVTVPLNPPPVAASVTAADDPVTTFPPASSTCTTGANVAPATVVAGGSVEKLKLAPAPMVIANALLTALVRPVAVAVKRSLAPAVLMLNPPNDANPDDAVCVSVPDSVPEPVDNASEIDVPVVWTSFPNASSSSTTTGDANATVLTVDAGGCWLNANCAAAADVMLNALLVALVKPPPAAVNV